jgi:hypothetical protein
MKVGVFYSIIGKNVKADGVFACSNVESGFSPGIICKKWGWKGEN